MNIQVLSAKKYSQKLKVTIQATGKLGFSDETAKEMELADRAAFIKFLIDSDTQTIYMSVLGSPDDDAFRPCKAGNYFYLNTTRMFDDLGVDYKTHTVIYDLTRREELDNELGGMIYQMSPRTLKKKKENEIA